MCATTPGRVQGQIFDGPTSCASWVSLQTRYSRGLFDIRIFIREVASMRFGWLRTKTATSRPLCFQEVKLYNLVPLFCNAYDDDFVYLQNLCKALTF